MKQLHLLGLYLLLIFLSIHQSVAQPLDKVAEIVKLTQVRATAEQITQVYINKFKRDYPKVPAQKWSTVEKSINHDVFVNNVSNLYRSSYSDTELTALLGLLQSGNHTQFYAQTKKTEAKMYELGKEYGKSVSAYIFQSIK